MELKNLLWFKKSSKEKKLNELWFTDDAGEDYQLGTSSGGLSDINGDKKILEEVMVEFYLNNFNEDMDHAWFLIKELHRRILKNDPDWHFFYEDKYSIIRCQHKFINKVQNFFKRNSIDYDYKGEWIDGSMVIEEYKDFFKPLFHLYSTLALKLNEGYLYNVSDRITHCFFNHHTYMAKAYTKTYGRNFWEAQLMGELAVNRSHYVGRLDYYNELEVLAKEKNKNDD